MNECKDCVFYWREDGEDYARCHFVERCPGDYAPCEEPDFDSEEV